MPNISTELKRMGYIIAPPFSKRDNNCHCPKEVDCAAKASVIIMKKEIVR